MLHDESAVGNPTQIEKRDAYSQLDEIFDRSLDLSATEKLVVILLAHRINNNRDTWHTQSSLAGQAGLSVRAFQMAVSRLATRSIVLVDQRGRGNRYRLDWNAIRANLAPVTSANSAPQTRKNCAPNGANVAHRTGTGIEHLQTNRKRPGSLSLISGEMLRDTGKLLDWLADHLTHPRCRLKRTPRLPLLVVSAAERALEDGKKPAALFVSFIATADFSKISHAQEDRAVQRLKAIQRKGAAG